MADTIQLDVLTPERKVLSVRVSEVQFRSAHRGYYGILPEHTAVMTPVGDGLLYYVQGGQKLHLLVLGGFSEVGPDHVTLLARVAETVDAIDVAAAQAALKDAQGRMKAAQDPEAYQVAQADLEVATLRLQAAGQIPTGH